MITRGVSRRRRALWSRRSWAPTWTHAAAAGVYLARGDGQARRFSDGGGGAGKEVSRRRPAPDLHPERIFSLEKFIADVKTTYDKYGRCVIAASEGIMDSQGNPIITQLTRQVERDAHGNVQLSGTGALTDLLCDEIKRKLGIKRVRGDTFRLCPALVHGCVSDVDQREAREVGEKAVQYAMWGSHDGSVAIKRTGFYSVDYQLVPLESVAGKTRVMEDEFIAACGTMSPTRTGLSASVAGLRHARCLPPAVEPGRQDSQSRKIGTCDAACADGVPSPDLDSARMKSTSVRYRGSRIKASASRRLFLSITLFWYGLRFSSVPKQGWRAESAMATHWHADWI